VIVPVLSGAQQGHRAEVFNGVQALDDDLLGGHPPGAGGEADADDGGQQLRGEPDRQREREQHRVDERAVQQQVDHEDRGDQHHHRPDHAHDSAGTRHRRIAEPRAAMIAGRRSNRYERLPATPSWVSRPSRSAALRAFSRTFSITQRDTDCRLGAA